MINNIFIDDFTLGYIYSLIWEEEDRLISDRKQTSISIDNINKNTLLKIIKDCKVFQENNKHYLSQLYNSIKSKTEDGDIINYDPSHAGFDFWIVRNGGKPEFWSGVEISIANNLNKAAKLFTKCCVKFSNEQISFC